jgi:16S rRNA (adenine1518-N6/adenine1519-N6)-dimethyltransferase
VSSKPVAPISVPALLKKYGLRPSKGLGQNFLVDENALHKVVKAAEISEQDLVLEVGPGLGSLTRYLVATARQVIAVELDKKLLPALHETLASIDNVEIVIGDILKLNPADLLSSGQQSSGWGQTSYKVVANIPYYITSALIRHLLEAEIQPSRIVLTLQKEVAQRICAEPPKLSLLALSVQVYGQPKIVAKIPAGSFYPPPKVDSSVVTIELYPDPLIPNHLLPDFFRLAKAGFSQKRKTLRNSLSAGMGWPKDQAGAILVEAGIDPQRRAQTLSLKEWETLTFNATQSN